MALKVRLGLYISLIIISDSSSTKNLEPDDPSISVKEVLSRTKSPSESSIIMRSEVS